MAKRLKETKKTTPQAVEKLEQRTKVIQLRMQGYSYAEIAGIVGVSKARSYQIIQEYIQEYREQHAESIDQMVELDCQRMDTLMRSLWTRFDDGDTAAAALILKLLERRARLFGFDAPEKQNIETSTKAYVTFSPDEWPAMEKKS